MAALPKIIKATHLFISKGHESLHPFLRNDGTEILPKGLAIATQTTSDGTVKRLEIYNPTPLRPNETTKFIATICDGAKFVQLDEYITNDGLMQFPLNAKIKRGFFGWKLV
ncbi:hypothetical protein [Jeongeupia naejangsanensis]|uniref:Uncharacterized protein n=1 Tax=Jeongeupia naejangsanensis TaxID=613195 RepID=A0ABS2BFA2_9NEIS|nr:hypothetical protein [Jeongeupia naejangsanensis]MBM3114287.1 hypothetical protein [Jeongeupia naejangsanensis]